MKKLFLLLFCVFLITSVSAQLADSPSPTLKINSKHTGLSPYKTGIETPYVKWKFNTGNGVESSPAIAANGTIYVGTFSDNFFALNPDGTVKWKFTREGEHFRSSPTLDKDGTIYVIAIADLRPLYNPALDSYEDMFGVPKLYALNSDGTVKWEFVAGGLASGILYSPAIAEDGTIYMISGGAKMTDAVGGDTFWAINPDGTKKWSFKTDDAMYSAAAIGDDGSIYFGCADGYFYALNPEGKEKWRFNGEKVNLKESSFNAVPSIGADGTIYAGSKDQTLYALTPKGKEKWGFEMNETVEATPSIAADGTIYAGSYSPGKNKYLYALSPEGKEIWRFETGQGVYGGPAIDADGILFFGSYDSYLYSLNPDGTERWKLKTDGGIIMPPTIGSDGTVYVGSWDHHLYAIGNLEKDEENKITEESIITNANVTKETVEVNNKLTDSEEEPSEVIDSKAPESTDLAEPFEATTSQEPVMAKTFIGIIIEFFMSLFGFK